MIFKIGFQHHAVTRLTVAHMLDGVVNFRHREQFGSRRNLAAGGKAHQLTQLIRCTGSRARDTAIARNQRKGRNRQRRENRTDGVEITAIRQRLKIRLPVEG